MANPIWIGTATTTAQVDSVTPANVENTDTFNIISTDESGTATTITFNATAGTVANVTAGLTAAWNANATTAALATASDQTTFVRLTAVTAGIPFHITTSTVDHGGANTQTLTRAAVTANSSPYDWSVAANWSTGAVPVNSDNVYFENNAVDVKYGLNTGPLSLTSLNISQSYLGAIGTSNAGDYLVVNGTTLNIGTSFGGGNPSGSGRIKINGAWTTLNAYNSATVSLDAYLQPVRLIGGAFATCNIYRGIIGFATTKSTETCSITTLNMFAQTDTDAVVTLGAGNAAPTTVRKTGGTLYCVIPPTTTLDNSGGSVSISGAGNLTTINCKAGTVTHNGSGTVTTWNVYGGTSYPNSAGTITTLNCYSGTTDLTRSNVSRTVTTTNLYAGAVIQVDPTFVTLTNQIANQGKIALVGSAIS